MKKQTVREYYANSPDYLKIRILDSLGNPIHIQYDEDLDFIASAEIEAVDGNNIYIAI